MEAKYGFDPWNLKGLIENSGVSKAKIARDLGISRTSLTNCLNGSSELCMRHAILLADYFDVSIEFIIGRRERRVKIENLIGTMDYCKGLKLLGKVESMKYHREKMELEMAEMVEYVDEIYRLIGNSVSITKD